jgi:16S rRNA A1518/A1519 N6-dimethyltransferase RsmA/KsgA/DIM1 with predicted DNA glycosylase/AP lyase activity
MLAAVVGAIFARRRKTLSNALAGFHGLTSAGASEILAQVGISSVRRPETLSIEEVVKVADRLSDRVSPVERGSPTTPVL